MSNFNDRLREAAVKLATGEEEVIKIPLRIAEESLPSTSNVRSHIASTMGRVKEVEAIGRISISKRDMDDENDQFFGLPVFFITLKRGTSKKVLDKKDIEAVKAKAAKRALSELAEMMPSVSDLEGDELRGALKMASRYQERIAKMIKGIE